MMTRTIQRQDSSQDTSLSQSKVTEGDSRISASSFHRATDSASDNDTSERPVREKLKKTSIASISKNCPASSRAHSETAQGDAMSTHHVEEDPVAGKETIDPFVGSRGRSLRKRSFEDFETTEGDRTDVDEQSTETSSGHVRKRSRDICADEGQGGEIRLRGEVKIPVQGVEEQNFNDDEMTEPASNQLKSVPQKLANSLDQDMRDSTLSPRRKRSREDTDTHREQKIPATKGIKAMRSSDEIEPQMLLQTSDNDATPADDTTANGQPREPREISATAADGIVAPNRMVEASRELSQAANKTGDEPFLTSQASFAKSGFAALSKSSLSPFSTHNTSSTTANNATTFGSVLWRRNPEGLQTDQVQVERVDHVRTASSGATPSSSSLGFGMKGASPFATSAASAPNAFAGATFGSGFGNTFGGAKLRSFAAPVGDAKWGGEGGVVTSFGAPAKDEDDDERSESEEESLGDAAKEQEGGEVNDKFHQQDVDTGEEGEESIFSSPRVNLYSWNGTAWKEGGRGTFKLNVPISKLNEAPSVQRTGRFIMRAHQTYRVLLNTPVFKQMEIGDSKGNEPQGKYVSFAVIEDRKPTPYKIKLSDEGESKTLYREVRKLQRAL